MLTLTTDVGKEHYVHIGTHMRECDQRECFAAVGEDPTTALAKSHETSLNCYVFSWNDVPVALTGVGSLTESIGVPWMLGTDQLEEVPKRIFWRASKAVVEDFHRDFTVLTNYIDERNTVSRRWIKHLGFEERETTPFGHLQLPFIRFERTQCVNPQLL